MLFYVIYNTPIPSILFSAQLVPQSFSYTLIKTLSY